MGDVIVSAVSYIRTYLPPESDPRQVISSGPAEFNPKANRKKGAALSTQATARTEKVPQRTSTVKDNWLGFVGDISQFSGEVKFKSMLRIDGHFSGRVNSPDGTLIVSDGAELTDAVINVAVARINGRVDGVINASKELVLGCTATVNGRLSAPALVVEAGAFFNGSCRRR